LEKVKMDFTRDYGLTLALSQPLYSGGRISSSYRISKAGYDIAEADLERQEMDITLTVIESFYGLLLARESVVVSEEAIKTAREFVRVVEARYKAGEASSFEVMRAEVEVSNLKPALISAKNGVALGELALKNLMSLKADGDVTFVGSFGSEALPVDLPTAIRQALDNRAELKMATAQARIAGEGLALAKAGRLPTLAVTADYDLVADKLKLENDAWEKTYNGYLVLSLPIFDGFKTKSQMARSRSEIKQAEIALAGARDGIELEVRSSLLSLEAAREALESQEKNVDLAGAGLEIANDRYVQGLATNLDVMDAQLALTRARNYRLQALHDLNLAAANLRRAMGVLRADWRRSE
jgi:outer membrane protein TolC